MRAGKALFDQNLIHGLILPKKANDASGIITMMFPILFRIGPFTLHTYGLFVALGVFAGLKITLRLAALDGYHSKETEESFYSLMVYLVLGGLAGARLLYIAIHWREFAGDLPGLFKIWEGGLVSYGGLGGALIGFSIWNQKQRLIPWRK